MVFKKRLYSFSKKSEKEEEKKEISFMEVLKSYNDNSLYDKEMDNILDYLTDMDIDVLKVILNEELFVKFMEMCNNKQFTNFKQIIIYLNIQTITQEQYKELLEISNNNINSLIPTLTKFGINLSSFINFKSFDAIDIYKDKDLELMEILLSPDNSQLFLEFTKESPFDIDHILKTTQEKIILTFDQLDKL